MEETTESGPPDLIIPPGRQEAGFATGVIASKPGKMVWLDFVQTDPSTRPPNSRATLITRIVVAPGVIDGLIAQLSKVRDR